MADSFDPERMREALEALREAMPDELGEPIHTGLTRPRLRTLLDEIADANTALERLLEALDPIAPPDMVLDPSDPKTTGMLIARLLEELEAVPLGTMDTFYGSGVYAIYYDGDFPAYRPIRGTDCPIYVGKADPADPAAVTPRQQGPELGKRLIEHDAARPSILTSRP